MDISHFSYRLTGFLVITGLTEEKPFHPITEENVSLQLGCRFESNCAHKKLQEKGFFDSRGRWSSYGDNIRPSNLMLGVRERDGKAQSRLPNREHNIAARQHFPQAQ